MMRERRVRWRVVVVFSLSGVTVESMLVLGGRVFKNAIIAALDFITGGVIFMFRNVLLRTFVFGTNRPAIGGVTPPLRHLTPLKPRTRKFHAKRA
jgi:hypothetical protein